MPVQDKLSRGAIVEIKFLDHCKGTGGQEPIHCRAYGRIDHITHTYIRLIPWDIDDADADVKATNQEKYVILRSTVLDIIRLAPA